MDAVTGPDEKPAEEQTAVQSGHHRRHEQDAPASPFLPTLVLALAFTGWATFQTVMLVREADALSTLRANQEPQMQNAGKLRQELDSVARDTAKLAENGNAGAKLIVDELRKRGVTINTQAAPIPQAAPAK